MNRKIKVLIVLGIVALTAAIGYPWYLVTNIRKQQEQVAVLSSFESRFGKVDLQRLARTKSVYIAYWKNDNKIHAALMVDGVWVNLGIVGE